MSPREDVLITASELAGLLECGEPVTVLDVRWQLGTPDGRADYEAGHLPGAVYVSLENELSDHQVTGRGRHPLPSGEAIERAARRWGVRTGVPVVVYDDWNRAASARAWWVLSAAGIPDVRILDGGLTGWLAAGGRVDEGTVDPEPGDVTVRHHDLYAGGMATLTADAAGGLGASLVDARAPERFRGDAESVDPVAGHIPGATNVPSTCLLYADGTFHPESELRRTLDGAAGVYCGSGVTASVVVAALAASGVEVALFPGSWSQWCAEPGRSVDTGD